MTRTRGIILIFIVFLSVLPAASWAQHEFPRVITDQYGNTITIPRRPERLISLTPHTTEILYSLELGEKIVAVDKYSNYPPDALTKENVGGPYFNYERIIMLKPDLIFIESSLFPYDMPKLQRLGIPVIAVRSDTYTDSLRSIYLIGQATGKEQGAKAFVKEMNSQLSRIAKQARDTFGNNKPRVFIEIWNSPMMTAGGDTFVDFLVRTAGGVNIAENQTGFPQINPELLLAKDPDVIILTTTKKEKFLTNRIWKNIKAVKNNRVYEIDPDIFTRPGMRMIQACRMLYEWFREEL